MEKCITKTKRELTKIKLKRTKVIAELKILPKSRQRGGKNDK